MLKLFFIIVILGYLLQVKNSKKYLKWCVVALFSAIAFRNEVCFIDTCRYVRQYSEIQQMTFSRIMTDIDKDPFFSIFSKCISIVLGESYTLWLAIQALLYCIPLYLLLRKYSSNITVSLVVFCAFGFAFFGMTGIRQNDAMAFTILSLYFLLQGKKKYSLLFALCAILFHKTAVIFLIVLILDRIPLNKKMLVVYITICAFAIVYTKTLLAELASFGIDDRFGWYLENQIGLNFSGLVQQALVFFASFFMLGEERFSRTYKIMLLTSLLGITFQGMSFAIAEMFRISMYFSIVNILLFANALEVYCTKHNSIIIRWVIIVLSLYFVTSMNNGFLRDYYFFFQDVPAEVYKELII